MFRFIGFIGIYWLRGLAIFLTTIRMILTLIRNHWEADWPGQADLFWLTSDGRDAGESCTPSPVDCKLRHQAPTLLFSQSEGVRCPPIPTLLSPRYAFSLLHRSL